MCRDDLIEITMDGVNAKEDYAAKIKSLNDGFAFFEV